MGREVTLQRSKDAAFLNRVVNDPTVFPYVSLGLQSPLDLSAIVADSSNYFLANEFGGFLLVKHCDYIYQVHTQFLPAGRGKTALKAGREAAAFMFMQTDCLRIDTTVAYENKAADWFTKALGFSKWDDVLVNGVPSHYYVLTLKQWARSLACR